MADTVSEEEVVETTPVEEPKSDDLPQEEVKIDDPSAEEPKSDDPPKEGEEAPKEGEDTVQDYEPFVMPEGMEVDQTALEDFQDAAKELKLPQAEAQRLVNLHAKAIQGFLDGQQTRWSDIKEGWAKDARALPELQDDKGDATASIAQAREAVAKIGGDALQAALDLTGAGNHPEVVKAFFAISKAMKEDGIVLGGATNPGGNKLRRMYPSSKG